MDSLRILKTELLSSLKETLGILEDLNPTLKTKSDEQIEKELRQSELYQGFLALVEKSVSKSGHVSNVTTLDYIQPSSSLEIQASEQALCPSVVPNYIM